MTSKLLIALILFFALNPAALAQPAADTAPPPPGPAPVLDRSLLEAELRELERQRAELSLGGPIAMMVGGGVAFMTGGLVLLFAASADALCEPDFAPDGRCSGVDDFVYVVGGVAMLGGAVIGIWGLVMLIDRAEQRRPLGVRIKEIRRQLGSGPSYGFHFDSGRALASIRLRF